MKPGDIIEYSTRSTKKSRGELIMVYQWGDEVLMDLFHPKWGKGWTVKIANMRTMQVLKGGWANNDD